MARTDEGIKIALVLGGILLLSKKSGAAGVTAPSVTGGGGGGGSGTNYASSTITFMQTALNFLLGTNLAEDGILGPQTQNAISTYQAIKGLPNTGVPDDATVNAAINDIDTGTAINAGVPGQY